MERRYIDNPSLHEQRGPLDVLRTFSETERKVAKSITKEEISYLLKECGIEDYIQHLRLGVEHKCVGSDFPILVIKGNKIQLEKYRLLFLLKFIDYQGIQVYHPVDFQLGRESYEEAQDFPGVIFIKIPYGSSTTEGFDEFRSDLITDVLTVRRENFNPTLVLMEETISGRLNSPSELIRYVRLDEDKLKGSLDGTKVKVDDRIGSRKKAENTGFTQRQTTYYSKAQSSDYDSKDRNSFNKKKDTKSRSAKGRI